MSERVVKAHDPASRACSGSEKTDGLDNHHADAALGSERYGWRAVITRAPERHAYRAAVAPFDLPDRTLRATPRLRRTARCPGLVLAEIAHHLLIPIVCGTITVACRSSNARCDL